MVLQVDHEATGFAVRRVRLAQREAEEERVSQSTALMNICGFDCTIIFSKIFLLAQFVARVSLSARQIPSS
jgi:hypothetical protein